MFAALKIALIPSREPTGQSRLAMTGAHLKITFVEEPVGELGEASSASTTQSIERFRKVANTLADEALRRRKGLSVIALNEALGKLPSVWSLQGVQAAETLVSAVTEVDSVESRESPALDISENGANGNQLSGVLRTVSRKSCRTTGTSFVSSRKSSCQITAQTESLALPSETQLLLEVCEKEPGERAEWELVPLLRILEKISFTSTLDSSIQHGLAHYMRFLAVTHGTTMFSQGDVGDLFYIILSGSVAVKVMAGDAVSVARTLRAGESFGELALLQRGGRRSATVVTVGHTEFLTIGADQYEELLSNLHQNEIRSKVEVVRHCKIFRNWPEKELYHVAAVMQLRRYGHDEVVVEQGADADSVCFIKSGQVRVMRSVPASPALQKMLARDLTLRETICTPHGPKARYAEAPYRPLSEVRPQTPRPVVPPVHDTNRAEIAPQPCESGSPASRHARAPSQNGVPEVWVHVCTLGPNESFGELAVLNGAKRGASVVTTTVTELLVLTRHDVLSMVTGEARLRLESLSDRYTSDEDMLRGLESSLRWERYKHGLVASILWERGRQNHLLEYSSAQTKAVQKRQVWK
eukprot:jgi/Botrbrau1/10308/Bobra.0120s0021.1